MTGRILDIEHWRAAQRRRAIRIRDNYAGVKATPRRRTLDEILGWSAPPFGGDAA